MSSVHRSKFKIQLKLNNVFYLKSALARTFVGGEEIYVLTSFHDIRYEEYAIHCMRVCVFCLYACIGDSAVVDGGTVLRKVR